MTEQAKKIADYYDKAFSFYRVFWHQDKESYAYHYGFWDKNTKTITEAALNENKFLADILKISSGERILDAGCGIGGSTLWLAKNYDVYAVGITLSNRQLTKARQLAEDHGVKEKTDFQLRNYLHTDFPDNHFDVVWAIESVCYSEDKKDFLREAYRILKPGGKLVVADPFLKRDVKDSEKKLYNDFLEGFVLPNLARIDIFENWMSEVGFLNNKFWDKSKDAMPSSKIIHRRTSLLLPFARVVHWLGYMPTIILKNGPTGIAQYKLLKKGTWCYGVFYGEK